MDDLPVSPQVFHYHWLAYWKRLGVISWLLLLGLGGILVWPLLGLGLLVLAVIVAVSLYLHWSWHTFGFTPDNRLILQHGVCGSTKDVISLFGIVTPHQIPVLGPWLDVGSVHLSPFGRELDLQHIANFEAFYSRLAYGVQRQTNRTEPPVQVVVQLFPSQRADVYGPVPFQPPQARPVLDYWGVGFQEDPDAFGRGP